MSEYPVYKKACDQEGTPIALLVIASAEKVFIVEYSKSQSRVSFRSVKDIRDAIVGGQIFDCQADEYEDILFDNWKLEIPQEVLNAKICTGEEANDATDVPATPQPVEPSPEPAPAPDPAELATPDAGNESGTDTDGADGGAATEEGNESPNEPAADTNADGTGEAVPAEDTAA